MGVIKIRASKKDIIWNYVGTIFSISSNFILIPLLLIFLTNEQIGPFGMFLLPLLVLRSCLNLVYADSFKEYSILLKWEKEIIESWSCP